METKANYSVVGFFILVVLAAGAGFIYWMQEYGRQGPVAELVVRIPGSANGLSIGSPVRFNGIQVGSIKKLLIDPKDPRYTIANTEVKANTPVYKSTTAKLELQGLTGAGYIELSSNGAEKGPNILQEAIDNDTYAELTADRSSLANLLTTADRIMKRLDSTVGQVQGVVDQMSGPLTETVKNVESFTAVLADNSDEIGNFLQAAGKLSDTVDGLSSSLDTTLASLNKVIEAVDPDQVSTIIDNAGTITTNVASASKNLDSVIDEFSGAVDTYRQFGAEADKAFKRVNEIVDAVDPQKVGSSVDDLAEVLAESKAAVASIRQVADNVNARSDDIDNAIANVSELSTKLNSASTKLITVLTRVDEILGSDDTESLSDQARATLTSVQQAAETLNARIGPILNNLDNFSGSGLRDVRGLIDDTRQTVNSLDRTVQELSRDPQRLIFGGQDVKSYDGRNRY